MVSDPFVSKPDRVVFLRPSFLPRGQWEGVISINHHKRGIARVRGPRIRASIRLKGTKTNVESAEVQSLDLDVNCEVDTLSTPEKKAVQLSDRRDWNDRRTGKGTMSLLGR